MTLDEIYDDVLEIVSRSGARISGDVEPFLEQQILGIAGSKDTVLGAVAVKAPEWFRSIGNPPEWIQEAEWPTHDGKPMVFIGQISIPPTSGVFHDEGTILVFIDAESGVTTNIIQVA